MRENKAYIKQLWDTFRFGKCFLNSNEFLQSLAGFFRPLKPGDFLPEWNQEMPYFGAPRSGSMIYVDTLDPPVWFVKGLIQDGIVMDEDALSALRDARPKGKTGKGARGPCMCYRLIPSKAVRTPLVR
jgi:hypothetical protein